MYQFCSGVSLIVFVLVVVGATANYMAINMVRREDTCPILSSFLLSDRYSLYHC
jgi:hypothetical protein